MEAVTHQI